MGTNNRALTLEENAAKICCISVFASFVELKDTMSPSCVDLELTVIRHGQTDWNAQGLLQGITDIPLNTNGKRQARLAGLWLKGQSYDTVYSSPLSRTLDTAKILMEHSMVWIDAIQGKEVEINQEPALIERNFGVFEGKPFDDLVEAEVSSGKGFGMYDPEGDESDSRRILLSTHGGWIFRMDKVLNRTKKIAKMAQASLNKVSHTNTGITKFRLQINRSDGTLFSGQCLTNFSVAHLEEPNANFLSTKTN